MRAKPLNLINSNELKVIKELIFSGNELVFELLITCAVILLIDFRVFEFRVSLS
jgi:hypothetical protein